jgi:hypothetical protein
MVHSALVTQEWKNMSGLIGSLDHSHIAVERLKRCCPMLLPRSEIGAGKHVAEITAKLTGHPFAGAPRPPAADSRRL